MFDFVVIDFMFGFGYNIFGRSLFFFVFNKNFSRSFSNLDLNALIFIFLDNEIFVILGIIDLLFLFWYFLNWIWMLLMICNYSDMFDNIILIFSCLEYNFKYRFIYFCKECSWKFVINEGKLNCSKKRKIVLCCCLVWVCIDCL